MENKKRRLEPENREFLPEWTDLYCFTLPDRAGAVPVCIICHKTASAFKMSNFKRHYVSKHKTFDENYPIGSDLRKCKIESLCSHFVAPAQMICQSMTDREKRSEASIRISWTLAKHMKPYTDADIVKECMVEAGNALFDNKADVVDTIRSVPLSASASGLNTRVLAEENYKTLKQSLNNADCYALALDEYCDITGAARLIIFVRYLDRTRAQLFEELLVIVPISGSTTEKVLYDSVTEYLDDAGIDMEKIVSVTTGGTPAMLGHKKSLVHRLSGNPNCNKNLISYHFNINQSVVSCSVNHGLQNKMETVIKIIKFVRTKSFLFGEAQFDDLISHNKSNYLVFERFFEVLEEIKQFLSSCDDSVANEYLCFLLDVEENLATVAFLTDIYRHIDILNTKLQGKGKLVCDLLSEVKTFSKKIDLFHEDIGGERLHFPQLKAICDKNEGIDTSDFEEFLEGLQAKFEKRFADFAKIANVVQLVNNGFSLTPNGEWTGEAAEVFKSNKAALQLEMIEFQEDVVLKELFRQVTKDQFWIRCVCEKRYPELRSLAIKLLTMFGSSYVFETAFSKMNYGKTPFSSGLADETFMRISCTNMTPNFKEIVKCYNFPNDHH